MCLRAGWGMLVVIVGEGGMWGRKGKVHELEADVGEVEGLGGVGEVNCCVHAGLARKSECLSRERRAYAYGLGGHGDWNAAKQ